MFKLRIIAILRKFDIGLEVHTSRHHCDDFMIREMPQIQVLVKSQTQILLWCSNCKAHKVKVHNTLQKFKVTLK